MDRHSWCPKCREYIHSNQVTFEETHDGCGAMVMEKDPEEELASLRAERDAALSRIKQLEEAVEWACSQEIEFAFYDVKDGEVFLAELRRGAGKEEV